MDNRATNEPYLDCPRITKTSSKALGTRPNDFPVSCRTPERSSDLNQGSRDERDWRGAMADAWNARRPSNRGLVTVQTPRPQRNATGRAGVHRGAIRRVDGIDGSELDGGTAARALQLEACVHQRRLARLSLTRVVCMTAGGERSKPRQQCAFPTVG